MPVLLLYRAGLFNLSRRVGEFAGDFGLAEAATAAADLIVFFYMFQVNILVIFTFDLIVAGFGNGAGRTPFDAGDTALVYIIQTVGKGSLGGTRAGRQFQIDDNTAAAVGDAFFRDKAVG